MEEAEKTMSNRQASFSLDYFYFHDDMGRED